jgi:hypothetical protein
MQAISLAAPPMETRRSSYLSDVAIFFIKTKTLISRGVLSLNEVCIYCINTTRIQYTIETVTETDMTGQTLLQ